MDSKYFDVDGFFGDYLLNMEKLKLLKYKLNSIPESSGMDYETPKVTGGMPVSSVETKAARREKIRAEIDKINAYFDQCERLINGLSEEEEYIAYEYFMKGKKTRYDVEKMAKKLNCSTSTMYRKIKSTRQNIKQNALRDGGA